jgi:hypothetical protein
MQKHETPSFARRLGARTRTALGVLVWTAPLALLLFLPSPGETSRRAETDEHPPEASMTMVARPLAFLSHQRVLSYPFEQVWPTAIRYLAVERQYKLTTRDPEAGYMMFEFKTAGGSQGSGSLEMFRTQDASGRQSVKMMISTGNGPGHLPHALAEGIAKKVRSERGAPANPPRGDKPKDPPKNGGSGPEDPDVDGNGVPLMPPAVDPGDL